MTNILETINAQGSDLRGLRRIFEIKRILKEIEENEMENKRLSRSCTFQNPLGIRKFELRALPNNRSIGNSNTFSVEELNKELFKLDQQLRR
ncbi:MAG: hypothetical protein AAF959_23615 [Cyanobacteria bacterium P01_D01_bin.56]